MDVEKEKLLAACAGAELVEDGMRVGLGTGTTVAYLLGELARRGPKARYVATSPRTEEVAKRMGLSLESFDTFTSLDLAIDGADQIAASGWLIKGGGGAHTREKIVAQCAERFVVIADSTKLVASLHGPVPLELLSFGHAATLRRLEPTALRAGGVSPDGGLIADYLGDVDDPAALARWFENTPGVLGHGLFAPDVVSDVLVGSGTSVRRTINGGIQ